MRLQVDLEFQQHEIKKLNNKYNVEMFSTKTHGGKAFAAEQKIREFKKILFKSKRLHKSTKTSRLDSKKIIKNSVQNMNKTLKNTTYLLKLLKKNLLKMKAFVKFMIFIEWLKLIKMQKDIN